MNVLGWLSNPIGSALGAVGSGLIKVFGNSVLTPILKGIENDQNAQRDVAVQVVQAEIAANQAKAAIKGLIYGIGIPLAIPFGAACLTKTFALGWDVQPLPPEYVSIEATILTAFFVSSPLTTLSRAGAARLLKA